MPVEFDAVSHGNATNDTYIVHQHTAGGIDRLAILFVCTGENQAPTYTAAYGGQAMTDILGVTNRDNLTVIQSFYKINPLTGVQNVQSWGSVGQWHRHSCITFTGVRSIESIIDSGTLAAFVDSFAEDLGSHPPGMVVDCVVGHTGQHTAGAGQTERANSMTINPAWANRYDISTEPGTDGDVEMSWTGADMRLVWHGYSLRGNLGGNQVIWIMSKIQDFFKDLKAGLIPPEELQNRYRGLKNQGLLTI